MIVLNYCKYIIDLIQCKKPTEYNTVKYYGTQWVLPYYEYQTI